MVSIIMGIYNCEDTLPEAIDSILAQTYTDWELIMCDDASRDSTLEIAQSYSDKYPSKIRVLHNEKNLMLAASLNRCIELVRGEYIARMDGDDISECTRLEKQVDFLDTHSEYQIVGTWMQAFDENGTKNVISIKDIPQPTDLPKFNPFHHATVMMRSNAMKKLNGYTVSNFTRRTEDVDLWFRFFCEGYRGYNLNEPLYWVREDENAYKRRKLKYSVDASRVLCRGIKLLRLPAKYYIYAVKPIVSWAMPHGLKLFLREKLNKSEN